MKKFKFLLAIFIFMTSFAFSNEHKDTVVCIHGFFRSKLNMILIERSLKKQGFDVVNYRYLSRDKFIEEHAKDLVDRLNKITNDKPNSSIHFVTHSMGGLVLRSALNQANCPEIAKNSKAVLIACPNQGSEVARKIKRFKIARFLFKDKAGHELMNEKNFDKLKEFPESLKVMQIVGTLGKNPYLKETNDGKVAISETHLNTKCKVIKVKASHSWICYSPTVIKEVKNFLNPQS